MRKTFLFALMFASTLLLSQEQESLKKLTALSDKLNSAVKTADWKQASELSEQLVELATRARNEFLRNGTAQQIDQILRWLPEDTETLLVAGEPFPLSASSPEPRQSGKAMMQGYVVSLPSALDEGRIYKSLSDRTLRSAVFAARHFGLHPDDGSTAMPLGMIAYQGCGAYEFEQPIDETVFGPDSNTAIDGHRVWLTSGKQYMQARDAQPRTETNYVTLPRPELMIVCNDKQFLSEIFSRMTRPKTTRALPDTLPEWKYIDRSAPVWGLRHIARDRSNVDPSLGEMVIQDPQAVGLAVQVVAVPTETIQVHWLSASPQNPWQRLIVDPQFKGIQTRKAGDNVWEVTGDSSDPSAYILIFSAMAALGFAVLV